jgi:hypothetical protein
VLTDAIPAFAVLHTPDAVASLSVVVLLVHTVVVPVIAATVVGLDTVMLLVTAAVPQALVTE